jgi:hypothetical protein
MAKVSVRPGVGDKVKVVGGNTRKDEEGIIYKDDGVGDSQPYRIEFSDGKSEHWFKEAHVELLDKGKDGKVSIWRSESWMLMTPVMQSYLGIQ